MTTVSSFLSELSL